METVIPLRKRESDQGFVFLGLYGTTLRIEYQATLRTDIENRSHVEETSGPVEVKTSRVSTYLYFMF